LAIEFGRLVEPELTPDFTTQPYVAAVAAAIAFRAMPGLWKLFEDEAINSAKLDFYAVELARSSRLFAVEIQPRMRPRTEATSEES
jgi:hypothetical protein